ncbi:MAG: cation:proton antiporter [Acidimicrobiales bacterium]
MSVTHVLLDILVVLLVAKLAAEVAERLNVPAVVGEIVAGVLIGPSMLGLVEGSEVLAVLAEIGVILLLLDVGFEMDLRELAAVGRASMSVAVVGVALPFAAGWAVAGALGMTNNEAMFVGAALTATSVGITARVFGDLRALTMVEARTVLGAAIADDVIGLVILTVVVRLASEGSVAPLSVLSILVVAVGFLVFTTLAGIRLAPGLFDRVAKSSRSSGTLVAVALAFTLAFAELASAAKLAPIVGAFVAGLALARTPVADRIRRELTPVGHLFIPVFFLQIGIEADVSQFGRPAVLGMAAALLAVAVAGKLASAAGMFGSPGNRLLVGIGMIPRGEVGLIFATLGLRNGILGQDVYGALLLVVLATTLLTPPLLKWRLLRVRASPATTPPTPVRPEGGWLQVLPEKAGSTVELAAKPPLGLALPVALEAASLAGRDRPGPRLLDWLGRLPDQPLRWDRAARERLFELLRTGGPRSWRFLALTGVLDRALPELGRALARRNDVAFELDPTGTLQWPTLARLRELGDLHDVDHPEWLLLGAIILDATDGDDDGVAVARQIVKRLDLGAAAEQAVAGLVADARLLSAAARRLDGLDEEAVLQLAVHLRSSEQARRLSLLSLSMEDFTLAELDRLDQLRELIQDALAHPELTGRDATNVVEQRRAAASRLASDRAVKERVLAAPRAYMLGTAPDDVARHAALCEPPPGPDEVRVHAQPGRREGTWRVDIVARDRVGLLAAETFALSQAEADVIDATIATWGDRCALASFLVASPPPDPARIEEELRARLKRPPSAVPVTDATVDFDAEASPWHTVARVEAPDRPGLLHAITSAFSVAGASVHSAKVATVGDRATDVFELTDRDGHKLMPAVEEAVRRHLAAGVTPGRRRLAPWSGRRGGRMAGQGNGTRPDIEPKQSDDRPEMTAP